MTQQCRVRAIDDALATVDRVCDTSSLSHDDCVFHQQGHQKKIRSWRVYNFFVSSAIPIPASTKHFQNHAQRVSARARGHVVGGDAATQKRRASAQDRVPGPTRAAGGGP